MRAVHSAERNTQGKHDLICHIPKVKAVESAFSLACTMPF